MHRNLIVGFIALSVLGVGGYLLVGRSFLGSEVSRNPSGPMQSGSFRSLAASVAPRRCSIISGSGPSATNGVLYIASGNVRGDFTGSAGAGSVESHMIVKRNVSYIWSSATAQGFKMSVPSASSGGQESVSGSLSYDQTVEYSCEPWSVDQSKFSLPTGISFSDVSQVQSGAAGAAGNEGLRGTAEQCKACESLSGAQKAQCLVALSCQ